MNTVSTGFSAQPAHVEAGHVAAHHEASEGVDSLGSHLGLTWPMLRHFGREAGPSDRPKILPSHENILQKLAPIPLAFRGTHPPCNSVGA
jgi:hypothetical protein